MGPIVVTANLLCLPSQSLSLLLPLNRLQIWQAGRQYSYFKLAFCNREETPYQRLSRLYLPGSTPDFMAGSPIFTMEEIL